MSTKWGVTGEASLVTMSAVGGKSFDGKSSAVPTLFGRGLLSNGAERVMVSTHPPRKM